MVLTKAISGSKKVLKQKLMKTGEINKPKHKKREEIDSEAQDLNQEDDKEINYPRTIVYEKEMLDFSSYSLDDESIVMEYRYKSANECFVLFCFF